MDFEDWAVDLIGHWADSSRSRSVEANFNQLLHAPAARGTAGGTVR